MNGARPPASTGETQLRPGTAWVLRWRVLLGFCEPRGLAVNPGV